MSEEKKEPLKVLELKRSEFTEMTEFFEEKAQQSRESKIAACCIVTEYEDGDVSYRTFHMEGSNWMKLLAELEIAKLRMLLRHGEILEDA